MTTQKTITPSDFVCCVLDDESVRFLRKTEWAKVTEQDLEVWKEHEGDEWFEAEELVTNHPKDPDQTGDSLAIDQLIEGKGFSYLGNNGPERAYEGLTEAVLLEMGFEIEAKIQILSDYENSIDCY